MTGKFRTDRDGLGPIEVPSQALYSAGTARALQNFEGIGEPLSAFPDYVGALVKVKKAAAVTNHRLGAIGEDISLAIVQACDEVHSGEHLVDFAVPLFEGSGGTSTNMNVNEVLANRAGQILGSELGQFDKVHPNDHVNRGQSTNDVVPSAVKLACFMKTEPLLESLFRLTQSFQKMAAETDEFLRVGRTCMQAAQPMTYGQLFLAYATSIERAKAELIERRKNLNVVPMGATAIGTGLGAVEGFGDLIGQELTAAFGFEVSIPENLFDAMQMADGFSRFSAELRVTAEVIGKIGADLVVLSSDGPSGLGEVLLPTIQPGSSIMAGKVNPVMPMLVQQIAMQVQGNDFAVSSAALHGQMEINHFEPVIAKALFDSLAVMTSGYRHFSEKCVAGLRVDWERSFENLVNSSALSSVFLEVLGYQTVSELVKFAKARSISLAELAAEEGLISSAEIRTSLKKAAKGLPLEAS
ncbi:MAG: lyase family protein [Pseudomonadota bacterium]